MKRKGFTLAEVLITLGIIGVVAAMTIPTLIADSQKAQYVSSLKKAYANFNHALAQMAIDNGCAGDLRCTGLFTTTATFGNELVKYYKINQNCKTETGQGCFAIEKNNFDSSTPTDTSDFDNTNYAYKFVTIDGISICIYLAYPNCNQTISTGATGNMSQTCGLVDIDVNGLKPPNVRGRDTFDFWITNGKGPLLYPRGGIDDYWNNTNYWWKYSTPKRCSIGSTNKSGIYCSGKVIEEGWQMNY